MARQRRRSHRGLRILTCLAVLVLAGTAFFWTQQNWIQICRESVSSSRLPQAFDGFRVVQISDLHGKEFGADSETLLEAVAGLEPDLIAITGDLIDSPGQLERIPALARGLSQIAPTYYVTGNHEWAIREAKEMKTLLRENGVNPLTNEYVVLEREGEQIVVAGVDDPNGPYDQKTPQALLEEIAAQQADPYLLLLAHRDTVEEYANWGCDLVLCGHGHGGVIRIPFVDIGLLGTDRQLFPTYDGGLYPLEDGGYCFVSRGMGSNTVPFQTFRLFNRPELPLLILQRS